MTSNNRAADDLASLGHRRIILIGYRGTGKTTVARLLAQRLGWQWLDADALLEERHAKTIKQIFAEEGEADFRAKEAALLTELCQYTNHVVATGGGVILRETNRHLLKQAGLVVWLTADASTLWERIAGDATTSERRPNLTTGGRAEVEDLLRTREPLYRACAQLIVSTVARSPEEVADAILSQLRDLAPV